MKVEFHPAADAELAAAIRYYEGCQPGLGARLYEEVFATLDWMVENPELPRLRKGYRRVNLSIFPFFIVYLLEAQVMRVVAVAHAHRRPNYWLERMQRG